jgi:hypothetical protein
MLAYGMNIISERPNVEDVAICEMYTSVYFIDEIHNDLTQLHSAIQHILADPYGNRSVINETISRVSTEYLNATKRIFNISELCIFEKEIAIVTSQFGDYDLKSDIDVDCANFVDWYYFTDTECVSDIRKCVVGKYHENVDDDSIHNRNYNMMYAKYYKVQALHIDLLQKYKYVVWMDSSIQITNRNFVNDLVKTIQRDNSCEFWSFDHWIRKSVVDEMQLSETLDKYANQDLANQVNTYLERGYPDTQLYECGFFVYKNTARVRALMDDWWREILTHSFQDQLSFPYVAWKNGIVPRLLNEPNFIKGDGSLKGSVWNNRKIGYVRRHNM